MLRIGEDYSKQADWGISKQIYVQRGSIARDAAE